MKTLAIFYQEGTSVVKKKRKLLVFVSKAVSLVVLNTPGNPYWCVGENESKKIVIKCANGIWVQNGKRNK
jgi:hypothetical protein